MFDRGRMMVSPALYGEINQEILNDLFDQIDAMLVPGLLAPGEFTRFLFSSTEDSLAIFVLNNPTSEKMDYWVGNTIEKCPFLEDDDLAFVRIGNSTDDEAEDDDDDSENEHHNDFQEFLRSNGITLPSKDDIHKAMKQAHLKKEADIRGVTPRNVQLRIERVPPYRLQLFQGDAVTHELPLWSLGMVGSLKLLLDFPPFCFETESEGGVFDGSNERWASWSNENKSKVSKAIHDNDS